MNRRSFLSGLAAAPLLGQRRAKPNVVIVLTDDQGYGDLACHGNAHVQTPNLDALYKESVRLTDFHVDPLCAPTRSALMTGRYSIRTGVWATVMGRNLLRRDEKTTADVFAENGYETGIFGKWHLGDNYPYRVEDRGWKQSVVLKGGGIGQTPDYWGNDYFDDTYWLNGRQRPYRGYCTDVFFRQASKFIELNRKKPWLAYIALNAPHWPYNVDGSYSKPYKDKGVASPVAEFYGMITNIDENVGKLRALLKTLRLDRDTIFVFMTDNGSAAGDFDAGMRAKKGSPYEGGHRVPCFVHWPGGGIVGGRDVAGLTAHIDVLPTLIELTGVKGPAVKFDGRSLAGALRSGEAVGERTLFVQVQQKDTPVMWESSAVLTSRYRLVNGKELYDVAADPSQKNDVAARHAEVVAGLRAEYEKWWADAAARVAETEHIIIGAEQENPTTLNCMDWHGPIPPWDQTMIRKAPEANGWWAVEVTIPGTYQFTLRQEPLESGKTIEAKRAKIRVAGLEETKPVQAGMKGVMFELRLPAGKTKLETWFLGGNGERGAFYVDVRRVEY